jgi:nucleotide-binding universal stress UspA family protein
MRTIMVPLDGSPFAEQALPLAVMLARRSNARVHLTLAAAGMAEALAAGGEYLKEVAESLEARVPGGVTCDVLAPDPASPAWPLPAFGSVADALARYVVDHHIDLVVLTTHGRGGVRRAWLGSTADAFVRVAPGPVLLVRPDADAQASVAAAEGGIRHIVIPLDGSETSERAIPIARDIGGLFGARYSLVRVVVPFTPDLSTEWYGVQPLEPTLDLEAAGRYLTNVANALSEGENVATHVIESASPAGAIIDFAAGHDADLTVMMSSGAGGIRRLLLGSVADKIVRSGSVPVLICNTQYVQRAVGVHDVQAVSVSPV